MDGRNVLPQQTLPKVSVRTSRLCAVENLPRETVRQIVIGEFTAMRRQLDEAEKRILKNLDAGTDAA